MNTKVKQIIASAIAVVFVICVYSYISMRNDLAPNPTLQSETSLERPPSTAPVKPKEEINLVFVGDIMLGRVVDTKIKYFDKALTTNHAPLLDDKLRSIISDADISMANLESPFGISGPHNSPGITFNADSKYAYKLAEVGFDIIFTANNHAMDQGLLGNW